VAGGSAETAFARPHLPSKIKELGGPLQLSGGGERDSCTQLVHRRLTELGRLVHTYINK
jgi:hypothetical protein